MRIMQLYRIESDYKNHKKRLQSIQKLDSKQKIATITNQQFYLARQHHTIRINAESFHQKEEISRRQHSLSLMNKTINQHSKRIKQQYEVSPFNVDSNLSGQKYSKKSIQIDQIDSENAKIMAKIQNTTSVYKSYRRNPSFSDNVKSDRQRTRKYEKQKLISLLKRQFKLEPSVVFPKSKTKPLQTDSQDCDIRKNRNQSSLRSLQIPAQ